MKNILLLLFAQILLVSGSCKKASSRITPDISFNGSSFSVSEDASPGTVNIPVILSAASDSKVTVDYAVTDSTALEGKDYTSQGTGTLEFDPGQITKNITVNILADTAGKHDTYFKAALSNPVNGKIKGPRIKVRIINADFATLAWSDEFDGATLDQSSWNYEQGAGGWGNNELENYTNTAANVHLDSGYLHISVLNPSPGSYTSGRITTKGKHEFTYGRMEIRAKLPEGQGIWPALWMLGANFASAGWPACGEIDIMELLGQTPSVVHGTLHWNSGGHQMQGGLYELPAGKFSSGFHTFTLIWTPNGFKWLVDQHEYLFINKAQVSAFPFDLSQFFIFNVAVGGNWPGNPDETTLFPQHMIVDYVRVYQ